MIEILNRQRKYPVKTGALKRLIETLEARHKVAGSEVTLALVGEARIRTLNRTWMGLDKPTDVLSFPQRKRGPDGKYYLGDIIISVPVAFRQAREKGHGLERELEVLAIHGFLHLLGYDHGRGIETQERLAYRLLRP